MAILDRFRRKSAEINAAQGQSLPTLNATEFKNFMFKLGSMDPERMWATQPNVRAAVDFIAMQVSHIGLQVFERDAQDGRSRNRDSNVAKALANPNPEMTGTELVRAIVSDIALKDEAWLMVVQTASGWQLRPLAVGAITIKSGTEMGGDLVVTYSGPNGRQEITQQNLLHFKGWTPNYDANGKSVIDTLKDVLAEQIAAAAFRRNLWQRGGQIGSFITRPATSAEWSETARKRFGEGVRAYKSGGANAGGILVLEDGMELRQNRFNAKEEQYLESIQLSLETVCRAFHLSPTMLGSTGGVTYANMREFRKMLFGETLGPRLKVIEDRFTTKLIPIMDPNRDLYAEFNIQAKLAGSFEEQADYIFKSTGAPWKTPNEARKLENLAPIEGGDVLVTPLNMTGAAPAAAAAPGKAAGPVSRKAAEPQEAQGEATEESAKAIDQALARFFKRQQASVLAKINAKADAEWWDAERWNTELAADLFAVAQQVTGQVSADILAGLGAEPSEYDAEQTFAFLQAVADSRAEWINGATREAIQEAIDDPGEDEDGKPERTPEKVFTDLKENRAAQIAGTLLATYAAFATVETGKQAGGGKATKSWITSSSNPRSSHSRMNGETVGINEKFSNRAEWPGDPVLGADGVANCKCQVRITFP